MIALVLGRNRRRRANAVSRLARGVARLGLVVGGPAARSDVRRRFTGRGPLPDVRLADEPFDGLEGCGLVLVDTPLSDEAMARLFALADTGARVAVLVPSGRGRGGAEVDALFGFGDDEGPRSLARAARFRRALFDRAVGQGAGEVLVAGDGGLYEPGDPELPHDAPDRADVAWDGAVGEAAPVRLVCAPDEDAEAHALAAVVADAVARGVPADACVIAHPDLDARAASLARALALRGLASDVPTGFPLAREPVVAELRAAVLAGAPLRASSARGAPRAVAARLAALRALDGVEHLDRAAFDAAIAGRRFALPAPGGVRLVPFGELPGLAARVVAVGGLGWGAVAGASARFVLAAAIRDAESTVFAWSSTVAGRPVPLAPVVEELGLVAEAMGRDAADAGSQQAAWRAGATVEAGLVERRRAMAAAGPTLGPWDGVSARPGDPGPVGVTSAEAWVVCPARFGLERVLGLGVPGDHAPDVSPAVRGRVVHAIVERFAREVLLGPPPALAEAARALHAIAAAVLADLDGAPAWAAAERDRWVAGLVDGGPKGVLAAWLDAELASGRAVDAVEVPFELALAPDVTLRGRIDRVDVLAGGRLVIDYKSGRPPDVRRVPRGLVVQPLAYAAAVGGRVATAYARLDDPANVGLTGFTGDADLVERVAPPRAPRALFDPPERDALLAEVAASVRRLRAGAYHPTVLAPEEAGCPWCPVARVCRRDDVRADALRRGGDPAVQRPLA